MQETAHKSFEQPEETRGFPNGEAPHFQYHVSGRLAIRMNEASNSAQAS